MKNNRNIACVLTIFSLLVPQSTLAQTNHSFSSGWCSEIKDEDLLSNNQTKLTDEPLVTEQTISSQGLTVPSLWWAKEQFDPFNGRLIMNWFAYPQLKQIDLVVNWQLWTILDYLQRYRLVNKIGTVAREYGYALRVFNQQKQCLATYKYNTYTNPPKWEIDFPQADEDSLQIELPN
ncbi:hypothetical protein IQ238_05810 [Pleurocapsales cyanobacterium LEGE 06147]|nr:hypothetical protein [Pleurocapsales cyanobacterium LEGE 06147]